MARKVLIGVYDWVREPGVVLSGGSWTLPLTSLLDHNPQVVAESANASAASTEFIVDYGQARPTNVFFLAGIIPTTWDATMRVQAYSDVLITRVYDSTVVPIWANDRNEWIALGRTKFFVTPATVNVRTVLVEIESSAVAGTVKVGVFGAYSTYEPANGIARNSLSMAYVDDSDIVRVRGGSVYITQNPVRRRLSFALDHISGAEVPTVLLLESIRVQSKPVIVVPYPEAAVPERTAIYGYFSKEPGWAHPLYDKYQATFEVDQFI